MVTTPSERLRILANWFDMYDRLDEAARERILADGPGQHGVQNDLYAIADLLPPDPPATLGPQTKLSIIALWFSKKTSGERMAVLDEISGSHEVQVNLRGIAVALESSISDRPGS